MRKESLYLDTSVISAYFDERHADRLEFSRMFWKKLSDYEVAISNIVVTELTVIGDRDLRNRMLDLTRGFVLLKVGAEEESLGAEYIEEGVIRQDMKTMLSR